MFRPPVVSAQEWQQARDELLVLRHIRHIRTRAEMADLLHTTCPVG